MKSLYAILGAGGLAREVFWHIRDCDPDCCIVFVDDITEKSEITFKGLNEACPIEREWSFDKYQRDFDFKGFIAAIGDPNGKEIMVKKAISAGLKPAPSFIHPSAIIQGTDINIGKGGVICPRAILTTNIEVGDYVVVNYNVSIGHDVFLDHYTSLNPGCHISGNVNIGKRCLIGAGAIVKEKISVASDVVVGAQSCLVKSVDKEGSVMVGVPAKELNLITNKS